MLAQLRAAGVEITEAEVVAQAGRSPAIGRPHVADVMVAKGLVTNRSEAFTHYLDRGRPGYAVRYATPTEDMIRLVGEAGGVSVVAHPWGRGSRRVIDAAALLSFAEAGLAGLEVDHEDHPPDDRAELRRLAAGAGLLLTGGSDYHGDGKVAHELGCNVTAPDQYARLLAAASRARRSGGSDVATEVGA
jgi:predicted metal-dependent phosphoesterase TrpH